MCQNSSIRHRLQLSNQEGFRLMLDIHYSDTWAGPWAVLPARWQQNDQSTSPSRRSPDSFRDSVETYNTHVLQTLRKHNITPDPIQVGNEITFGMLWPTGRVELSKADNWNILPCCYKRDAKPVANNAPRPRSSSIPNMSINIGCHLYIITTN